jgi:hypothetical protein
LSSAPTEAAIELKSGIISFLHKHDCPELASLF